MALVLYVNVVATQIHLHAQPIPFPYPLWLFVLQVRNSCLGNADYQRCCITTHRNLFPSCSYWGSVATLLVVPNGFRLLTKRLAVELGTAMSMPGLRLHLPAGGWFDNTSFTSLSTSPWHTTKSVDSELNNGRWKVKTAQLRHQWAVPGLPVLSDMLRENLAEWSILLFDCNLLLNEKNRQFKSDIYSQTLWY